MNMRRLANIVLTTEALVALVALWFSVETGQSWGVQQTVLAGLAAGLFAALKLPPSARVATAVSSLAFGGAVYVLEIILAGASWGLK